MFNVIISSKKHRSGSWALSVPVNSSVNPLHGRVHSHLPAQHSTTLFITGSLLQWLRFEHSNILTAKDKMKSYIMNLSHSFLVHPQWTQLSGQFSPLPSIFPALKYTLLHQLSYSGKVSRRRKHTFFRSGLHLPGWYF